MDTTFAPKPKSKPILFPVKVDEKKRVIPKGDTRKPRYWRVNIGKKLTGTKKERRFFETESEAKDFIRTLESSKKEKGHSAFSISGKLANEALALNERLAPLGVSLTAVVEFYLRNAPQGTKKTVMDLIPDYLLTKKEGPYRYAQKVSLNLFAKEFGDKPIASIFAPAVEKWIKEKKWEAINEGNYMRDLSMFFRWAVWKEFIGANPMDKIKRPDKTIKSPEIFSVDEARQVLEAALLHPELGLLAMYSIGLFAGVRVEELERMNWKMIDHEEGEIRLPGEITKTKQPRNIPIDPALKEALAVCPERTGQIVSLVNLRLRRDKLLKHAKVSGKKNALRHSMATYHAALNRNPGNLQMILGQKTPSVLFDHYIAMASKKDAESFFMLRPPFASPKEGAVEPPQP